MRKLLILLAFAGLTACQTNEAKHQRAAVILDSMMKMGVKVEYSQKWLNENLPEHNAHRTANGTYDDSYIASVESSKGKIYTTELNESNKNAPVMYRLAEEYASLIKPLPKKESDSLNTQMEQLLALFGK